MIPLPSLVESLEPVSRALANAAPDARVNWSRGLSGGELAAMWRHAVAEDAPLPLASMVGEPGEIMLHLGKNSLPVFAEFAKPLVSVGGRVQGYNRNPGWVTQLIGPGHFRVEQESEAVVRFDYTRLPESAPPGFPPLTDNDGGLRRLVFGGMIDRVRRVSEHVTIGRAWRGGEPMRAWFLLVRQDRAVGDHG